MTTTAPKNGPAPAAMTTPAPPPQVTSPPPRMNLANVRKGRLEVPLRVLVYGVEGVGKSTFAAAAPAPIFLGADSGTSHLDIARLPEPQSWEDALDAVRMLQREPHDFRTLVVDPVSWLEPLAFAKVCADAKWSNIEDPGYGKGYTAAVDQWRILVAELERLWLSRRMHIVMTAHSLVKAFKNPEGEDFERYQIAMNEKAAALLKQWADIVLFARHEAFAQKDTKTKRVRGISTGARVLHTAWRAAFDAKNRHNLPDELPLAWSTFYDAVRANGPERAAELRAQIEQQLAELDDRYVIEKARGYVKDAGDDVARLAEIANAVALKVEEKRNDQIPNA